MLHLWVYQLFDTGLLEVAVIFKRFLFALELKHKFGIKTYLSIFKFVAGVNREFIWEFMFCLCNNFFISFW